MPGIQVPGIVEEAVNEIMAKCKCSLCMEAKAKMNIKMQEVKEGPGVKQKVIATLYEGRTVGLKFGIPHDELHRPDVMNIIIIFLECGHWSVELAVENMRITSIGDEILCCNCVEPVQKPLFEPKYYGPGDVQVFDAKDYGILPHLAQHREIFNREEADRLLAQANKKVVYDNEIVDLYNDEIYVDEEKDKDR